MDTYSHAGTCESQREVRTRFRAESDLIRSWDRDLSSLEWLTDRPRRGELPERSGRDRDDERGIGPCPLKASSDVVFVPRCVREHLGRIADQTDPAGLIELTATSYLRGYILLVLEGTLQRFENVTAAADRRSLLAAKQRVVCLL